MWEDVSNHGEVASLSIPAADEVVTTDPLDPPAVPQPQ